MTDEDKIMRVFRQYEEGGLVSKDLDQVLDCIAEQVIGIGIGEQGFVHSKEDVRQVILSGQKHDPETKHSVSFERVKILVHEEGFANLCAKVIVRAEKKGTTNVSRFLQSLTLIRQGEDWKICALHASTPVVTEESVEAYPLKIAEETLKNLKEKIGEKAYLAEEQYRQAVLADTVAFYIINFSTDVFEKCQLNGQLCVKVEPGTPYEKFLIEKSPQYILDEDRERFLQLLSQQSVKDAFEKGNNELSCEYRMWVPDGTMRWMFTTVRLIIDVVTGERKGIMYVKDIDAEKRRELEMIDKADRDEMTGVLNKAAFTRRAAELLAGLPRFRMPPVQGTVSECLVHSYNAAFIMLDVDNFKVINDTCGHPMGDRALIAVAGILKELFGEEAVIGRMGGDEFAVFVHGTLKRKELCDRLNAVLSKAAQINLGKDLCTGISCSIGVALRGEEQSIDLLYRKADDALYRAKLNGKSRYFFV